MNVPVKPNNRKSSPFYWWRRFPTPVYPKTRQLYNRIQNGEFDPSSYIQQVEWEKKWMKQEIEEEKQHYQDTRSNIFYDEIIRPISKTYNKRIKHLTEDSWKDEDKRISSFINALKKEFMLPKETIFEFVSNFEGPIKECYDALCDFQSKFNPFRNRPNSNELETIKESLMEYLKTYKYNT
jgi:hypothetical protein